MSIVFLDTPKIGKQRRRPQRKPEKAHVKGEREVKFMLEAHTELSSLVMLQREIGVIADHWGQHDGSADKDTKPPT